MAVEPLPGQVRNQPDLPYVFVVIPERAAGPNPESVDHCPHAVMACK